MGVGGRLNFVVYGSGQWLEDGAWDVEVKESSEIGVSSSQRATFGAR